MVTSPDAGVLAETRTEDVECSPFQRAVLSIPQQYHLLLTGGRGGGKSYCLALLALRHVVEYADKAKWLFSRQTHQGCEDFSSICRELFGKVWGPSAKYNATSGLWKFPNGATGEINQLSDISDYQKYQGRNWTLHLADEIGGYPDDSLYTMLRSNLRGPAGVQCRVVYAANPGGPGHHVLQRRWVNRSRPWQPFRDGEDTWVVAHSTYRSNPYIDQQKYLLNLEASCSFDAELLRAWRDGDFDIARGAFFAGCLDLRRVLFDMEPPLRLTPARVSVGDGVYLAEAHCEPLSTWIAMDYGVGAPCVVYLAMESPGVTIAGRFFPRNSCLLLDELSTAVPGQPNQGMGWTIPRISEGIKEMCERWSSKGIKVRPDGCADDACFARSGSGLSVSVADEFRKNQVHFYPAKKGTRTTGWELMRTMLSNASSGAVDKPGLYVNGSRCPYWLETVPVAARDPRKPDDLDSRGPDHACDCTRYLLLARRGPGYLQREFKV